MCEVVRYSDVSNRYCKHSKVHNYFSVGFGDYTKERKQLFANYTVNDIAEEINEYKKIGNKKSLTDSIV